jgi:hypothetical protein
MYFGGAEAAVGLRQRGDPDKRVLFDVGQRCFDDAVDLGKSSTTVAGLPGGGFGSFPGRFETADTMWVVRAGVNYKFGG